LSNEESLLQGPAAIWPNFVEPRQCQKISSLVIVSSSAGQNDTSTRGWRKYLQIAVAPTYLLNI
jgi:hypothetical protein